MPDTHLSGLTIQGAAIAAADVALSAGFGTTATVVPTGSDRKGKLVITSSGTGQGANPTATITPKDAYDPGAQPVVCRGLTAGDSQLAIPVIARIVGGALEITLVGTPVAAQVYTIDYAMV